MGGPSGRELLCWWLCCRWVVCVSGGQGRVPALALVPAQPVIARLEPEEEEGEGPVAGAAGPPHDRAASPHTDRHPPTHTPPAGEVQCAAQVWRRQGAPRAAVRSIETGHRVPFSKHLEPFGAPCPPLAGPAGRAAQPVMFTNLVLKQALML